MVPGCDCGEHGTGRWELLQRREMISTLQFRRKLTHKIMENTIGVDTVDSGRPRRSKCMPAIVPCDILKVKKHEGSYDKKAKNTKNPMGISKTEMRQL